jgi:integrating conjugative element protein (TIGR03757 family)
MNKFSILFMAMMCFFTSLANADTPVEVFVDSPVQFKHIPGIEIVMYDLSLPEQVNARFLPEFPGDPVRAEQLARDFFASSKGKEYQAAFKSAYVGQLKVAKYQLKKIPAVVFDAGRYVVYGTENPVLAHSLYIEHIQSTDPVSPEETTEEDDHEE